MNEQLHIFSVEMEILMSIIHCILSNHFQKSGITFID